MEAGGKTNPIKTISMISSNQIKEVTANYQVYNNNMGQTITENEIDLANKLVFKT